MKALVRVGLGGRLLAIVLIVVSLDFFINSILFESARQFGIQEDEAAMMAEHVVVAHRLLDRAPPADRPLIAGELNTERFTLSWSPSRVPAPNTIDLPTLHEQMLAAEPGLTSANLHLKLLPLSIGGDIGGTTTLRDGSVATFRFSGQSPWSLQLGRLASMALPSGVLLVLAWLLFRLMLKPLRTLVEATSNVGVADSKPLPETGEGEVLQLIRAFNAMQERIRQLLAAGSQTLLAVGHDLRTPLARLQLRIEDAAIDVRLREEIGRDIKEMRDLLQSLQTFVESGQDGEPLERIDIAVTARTLIDDARDRGQRAIYRGPPHLEILTRPVAVRRALSNLLENALAYGGNAKVEVAEHDGGVAIAVEDDGPGIPVEHLAEVLLPFVRLDNARARNTAGMGLGLPIVDRVVKAEGGVLLLDNKPSGGLRVTIRLPRTLG